MHRFTGALLALCLLSCDDFLFGEATGEGTEVPDTADYAGVLEVLESNCFGCHGAAGTLGGLDLETDMYGATVGVVGQYGLPIVLAGDPDNSMLYLKAANLHPPNTGTDMPPGSGGLPDALSDVILLWIEDGAPDANGNSSIEDDTGI